jgi:hypothetical protein
VVIGLGVTFTIFGNKMINIVLYGMFLWILLTGYPNLLKAEMLNDIHAVWGGKQILGNYKNN